MLASATKRAVILAGGLVAAFLSATPCALAKDPVTLRFTVWDGDVSLNVIRGVLHQFEVQNPDIRVKLESIPDYNGYHQKMLTMYAANTAPDVSMMDPGHVEALAKRGALMDLSALVKKTPGFNLGDYYRPIVDALSWNHTLYVLPRDIAPAGLIYYNKRAFDEAHIPYPDGSWTWDFHERPELREKDFLWVMHQLTKPGPNGKPSRYGYCPSWPGIFADNLMYSCGQKTADDSENPTKVLMDTPMMVKCYDLIVDLSFKKKWMPSNVEVTNNLQQGTETIFVKGEAAMFQNGIWEVPNIRRDMKPGAADFFDWDIAPFPAFANGHRGYTTGGSGYCIFSSTEHPAEAWRLTQYMAGPPAMRAMALAGIAQPAIRRIALSDAWIPGRNTPLDQRWPAHRIVTDAEVPYVHFPPASEYWPEVSGLISAQTDSIFNGLKTPAAALAVANQQAQARLDALRKEENLSGFNWTYGIATGVGLAALIVLAVYWPERGVRYSLRERRESRSAYWFIAPLLIGLCFFTIGPMILSLIMSFLNWDMIRPAQWRGLHNYTEAFIEDPRYWGSLKVTALYTFVSTPLGLVVALTFALLLNQKVRGIPLFRSMYYFPSIASAVALTLVTRKILSPDDGLLNTIIYSPLVEKLTHLGDILNAWSGTKAGEHVNWLGNEHTAMASLIMLSLLGVGGAMIILLAALQGVPQYYYEAATMDGASPARRIFVITLPMISPSLFFCLVTGFIGSFQIFTQVYVLTSGANGGPNNSLYVYMISLWSAAFVTLRMGYAAALAWVLFAVILLFTLIQFRASRWVYYEADVK